MSNQWESDGLVPCPCCHNEYDTDDHVPFTPAEFALHRSARTMLRALKHAKHALEVARDNVADVGGRGCEEAKFFRSPLRIVTKAINLALGA